MESDPDSEWHSFCCLDASCHRFPVLFFSLVLPSLVPFMSFLINDSFMSHIELVSVACNQRSLMDTQMATVSVTTVSLPIYLYYTERRGSSETRKGRHISSSYRQSHSSKGLSLLCFYLCSQALYPLPAAGTVHLP